MTINKKLLIPQVLAVLVIMLTISGCNTYYEDYKYKDTYQKVLEIIEESKKIDARIQDGQTLTGKDITGLWEEVNDQIIRPTQQLRPIKDPAFDEVISMLSARANNLYKYYIDICSQRTSNTLAEEKSITLQPYPDITNLLDIKELRDLLHSYTFIRVPPIGKP